MPFCCLHLLHRDPKMYYKCQFQANMCVCVCVSGCMYHPAELYSGRNTWDSYPAGGPSRGQWAPVNSRPWSHTQRSAELTCVRTGSCLQSCQLHTGVRFLKSTAFTVCFPHTCAVIDRMLILQQQRQRPPVRL